MAFRVEVDAGMPVHRALRLLKNHLRRNGVPVDGYVFLSKRNRRKDFFEKPGVKRRRKRHLAANKRRRAELIGRRRPVTDPQRNLI
jgi:ribosomal protein S21